jgi:hypothetical protein
VSADHRTREQFVRVLKVCKVFGTSRAQGEVQLNDRNRRYIMKTNSKIHTGVKVTTTIKAGGFSANHNRQIKGLSVKSGIKAGEGIYLSNHSRRLA